MQIQDFTYQLPKDRIASRPPAIRGHAKLLVLDRETGNIADKAYREVTDYLRKGDVVVLNNTKVIKARLYAQSASGELTELVLVEQHGKRDDWHRHKVLFRGKLDSGDRLIIGTHTISVSKVVGDGLAIVESKSDLMQLAEDYGNVPLPPYMKREATTEDVVRYQTEFAKTKGSVAAPTASLNMTKEIIQGLKAKGVIVVELTLHVGLGTFLPIRVDDIQEHKMHSEWFHIPMDTVVAIQRAKNNGNKVLAVGTTVARTLEYSAEQITKSASELSGEADIFIYPGYDFKMVDMLLTNFHAPKSTVLMLAAAFTGWDNLKSAYDHALNNGYSFLSYGDSILIL